jgi:hypothetical protein
LSDGRKADRVEFFQHMLHMMRGSARNNRKIL